jgi:hypothetical protein
MSEQDIQGQATPVAASEPAVAPVATPPADDGIRISKEEFAQMSAYVGQLEAYVRAQQEKEAAASQKQNIPAPEDIDKMSNRQLLQYLQENMAGPILTSVMTLAVKEEMRECQNKYPDFSDFKADIHRIASENTQLSLEQAYHLAKSGKAPSPKPSTQPVTEAQAQPNAPTPPPRVDKHSVPASSTKTDGQMSVREAAQAALAAIKYE